MPTIEARITTTGTSGAATGTKTTIDLPPCVIVAVKVDYDAAAPDTTDLTVTETKGLGRALLTLTNQKTDKVAYPTAPVQDASGGDVSGVRQMFVTEGPLQIDVAGCDALTDAVVVTIQYTHNREVI